MKFIFNFGLLIMLFINFGCSSFDFETYDYEKIADKITVNTAKKLKDERGLVLVGTGGRMMNDIQMMMMGFNFYKIVDIRTARQLLIYSVQEYLSSINSDKNVRPYLHNYPFTEKNIEIVIYFYDVNGSNVPVGSINIASLKDGEITYYVDCSENYILKPLHEEAYLKALKIAY